MMSAQKTIKGYLVVTISSLATLVATAPMVGMGQDLAPAEQVDSPLDVVHRCGIKLLRASGKTGPASEQLPILYMKASHNKDAEFMQYMMAVIYVESRFRKEVESYRQAIGLMQMTEIAVVEAAKRCNMKRVSMRTLHDSYTNVKFGTCYLSEMYKEADGNWDRTLVLYNGGYKQLERYDRGDSIATETANYVLQVRRAQAFCTAN